MKLTLKYKKLYINIDTDCTTDMILEQHSSKEIIRETMLDVIIGDKTVV